jgi:hypothetical protein
MLPQRGYPVHGVAVSKATIATEILCRDNYIV